MIFGAYLPDISEGIMGLQEVSGLEFVSSRDRDSSGCECSIESYTVAKEFPCMPLE